MSIKVEQKDTELIPPSVILGRNNGFTQFFSRWENIVGAVIVLIIVLAGLLAHWIEPYSPNAVHFDHTLQPPSWQHLLGTDSLGRDVLSRILAGTNASLSASVGAVAIALLVGSFLGLVSGYWSHSFLDELIMRVMDSILVLPPLVLALAIAFILGDGMVNAMLAISVVFTPQFARVVRSKTLTAKTLAYIEAARAQGSRTSRILLLHIMPSVMQPAFVLATLSVGNAIIVEASLAYLGLGLEPPAPSWGFMVSTNVNYLAQAPWLIFAPSVAIALSVLGITLVGQGLQQLSPLD